MRKLLLAFSLGLVALGVGAKEKAPEVQLVSVIGEGVGNGGRPMLTVTMEAKKTDKITTNDLRNAAVRAVLFNGWGDASNTAAYDASTSHPSICGSADVEAQHADYFADFFNSGDAAKYADLVDDTRKVKKVGKLFQVSQSLIINVKDLRAKMEKDKVVRSLRTGW